MSSTNPDVSRVAGPAAMAKPGQPSQSNGSGSQSRASSSANPNGDGKPKKKRHRAGKNRKKRRQSFAAASEASEAVGPERPSVIDARTATQQASFYRLNHGNRSNTSLESEALLDHREQSTPSARRRSIQQGFTRPSLPFGREKQRPSQSSVPTSAGPKARAARSHDVAISEDDEDLAPDATDRTPLLGSSFGRGRPQLSRDNSKSNYGSHQKGRRSSVHSKASSKRSKKKIDIGGLVGDRFEDDPDYDVNNPPSVPGSPKLGSLDDVMVADMPSTSHSDRGRDAIINIDFDREEDDRFNSISPDAMRRRHTVADLAERDVCFPANASEIGDEDGDRRSHTSSRQRRRRRPKQWPDLEILEEWSREEKEERSQQEYIRAKKISEPVMVGGRLRPRKNVWHREEDDAPFRFTYFNELFEETIHARTISDLCQDGGTFRELFIPDPVELSDESEDDEDEEEHAGIERPPMAPLNGRISAGSKAPVPASQGENGAEGKKPSTGTNTPSGRASQAPTPVPGKAQPTKRYGARPTFWLDVLSPTEVEMKVLAKAFGIHQLTIEDILMDEPREKVELFQSYYFVNYRSFEQDKDNEEYMEPINMYVVVFRDGVITFHHSQTPHPANVRRRIRQLNDYMSPTADWVSYAIIDDVTDAYAPMVQQIENEVDDIDDEILYMHQHSADDAAEKETNVLTKTKSERAQGATTQGDMGGVKTEGEKTAGESGGDMLRRVGECRKKVMGLYRLLGNKADVIKGFAKRCNEHWEVAPRSEIGLYLGDIQDHIVTMTGNLSHYEKYVPPLRSYHSSNPPN